MINIPLNLLLQGIQIFLKVSMLLSLTFLNIISAGLFQDVARLLHLQSYIQTSIILSLIIITLFLSHVIRQRYHGKTFYCDFMFGMGISISLIIGSFYCLANKRNFTQQLVLKLALSILLPSLVDKVLALLRRHYSANCPVCLEQLGKRIIQTKCCHTFHQDCLWRWVEFKRACPLCVKTIH